MEELIPKEEAINIIRQEIESIPIYLWFMKFVAATYGQVIINRIKKWDGVKNNGRTD